MAVLNYTPQSGVLPVDQELTLAKLAQRLSGPENALMTRGIGGILGMAQMARDYDYPDTALGLLSLPAKALTSAATGIPKAFADQVNTASQAAEMQVAGLSDVRDMTDFPLGLAGGAATAPYRRPAGSLGAFALPMPDNVRDAYAQKGKAFPLDAPVGRYGKELMVPAPYSKTLTVPKEFLDDLDAGLSFTEKPGMTQRRELDIQDYVGKKIFPLVGDRSSRVELEAVLGKKIDPDVQHFSEGGFDYTLDPQTGLWASHPTPILKLQNKITEEGGGIGVSLPMAGASTDFSMQAIDLSYDLGDISKMNKTASSYLDKAIESRVVKRNAAKKKAEPYPDFPGIKSPKAYDYFKKYPDARKFFMEELDKKDVRAMATMPDAIKLRHAITEPGLRNLVRGDTDSLAGQSFVDFSGSPQARTTSIFASPHNTYAADLFDNKGAGYLGGLPFSGVPRSLLFPDFYKEQLARGLPLANIDSNYKMAVPFEKITNKKADAISSYLLDVKNLSGE